MNIRGNHSDTRIGLAVIAVILAVLFLSLAFMRVRGLAEYPSGDGEGLKNDQTDEGLAASVRVLEHRIQVLEDIIGNRKQSVGRPVSVNVRVDRDVITRDNDDQDLISAKLVAVAALQRKFDAEAGTESQTSLQVENKIEEELRGVIEGESRYMPLSMRPPECRRTRCRMQYRFSDPSVAEFASSALLMQLSELFSSSDMVTLPNQDGSYELLIFSQMQRR